MSALRFSSTREICCLTADCERREAQLSSSLQSFWVRWCHEFPKMGFVVSNSDRMKCCFQAPRCRRKRKDRRWTTSRLSSAILSCWRINLRCKRWGWCASCWCWAWSRKSFGNHWGFGPETSRSIPTSVARCQRKLAQGRCSLRSGSDIRWCCWTFPAQTQTFGKLFAGNVQQRSSHEDRCQMKSQKVLNWGLGRCSFAELQESAACSFRRLDFATFYTIILLLSTRRFFCTSDVHCLHVNGDFYELLMRKSSTFVSCVTAAWDSNECCATNDGETSFSAGARAGDFEVWNFFVKTFQPVSLSADIPFRWFNEPRLRRAHLHLGD